MKILKPTPALELTKINDVVNLLAREASISEVHIESELLNSSNLKNTNISESRIVKTDFSHAIGERFSVLDTEFKGCNFTASKFPNSSWHVVCIDTARCSGMQMTNSSLKNVTFQNSKLELMNFRFSKLESVIFEDCVLDDVDFNEAQLKNVTFINCTINAISFVRAKMQNVDLSQSRIEGIKGASSLKGATINYDQLMHLAPLFAAEAGIKVA